MKYNKKIEVVDHDPQWAEEFDELKQVYSNHLTGYNIIIEHVGSTSVKGLKAKPILDIDIIIQDNVNFQKEVIDKLSDLGYEHIGDLGIIGREAFQNPSPRIPFTQTGREWMKHNLYVCREGSISLRNHLTFRDHLRTNSADSLKYGEIKSELAARFPHDIDSYIAGKTDFIIHILNRSGFSRKDIDLIGSQNIVK